MESEKYNGWANYETWCVNLWLTNDPGGEQMVRDMASEDGGDPYVFADHLKDVIEDLNAEVLETASMASDLLGAAIGSVNWFELAETYIRDYRGED